MRISGEAPGSGWIRVWFSETDTYNFAAGNSGHGRWPASYLSGHRLYLEFDPSSGDLVDLTVDGKYSSNETGLYPGGVEVTSDELDALVSTYLGTGHPTRASMAALRATGWKPRTRTGGDYAPGGGDYRRRASGRHHPNPAVARRARGR